MNQEQVDHYKAATAHVINYSKIDSHYVLGKILCSIRNTDTQLTNTKNTTINTVTKDGPEYHESNFAEKVRIKKECFVEEEIDDPARYVEVLKDKIKWLGRVRLS